MVTFKQMNDRRSLVGLTFGCTFAQISHMNKAEISTKICVNEYRIPFCFVRGLISRVVRKLWEKYQLIE